MPAAYSDTGATYEQRRNIILNGSQVHDLMGFMEDATVVV